MAEAHLMEIVVINSSAATLAIRSASLSAGAWAGPPPKVGSMIESRGGVGSWLNGAQPPSMGVGGGMVLAVSQSARIDISWSWASGAVPTGSATGSDLDGVEVGYELVNARTDRPQLAVQVRNAPG
jgi:hypothetical protein